MVSWKPMRVLCSLIISIKSLLVDEIVGNDEIPRIIGFLDYKDLQLRLMTMDCILEIGYFGRKEAIEGMLKEGLVRKLVELQRSDLGGDLIDIGKYDDDDGDGDERPNSKSRDSFMEMRPFASCVARFAMQLEVGEGLRRSERSAIRVSLFGEDEQREGGRNEE